MNHCIRKCLVHSLAIVALTAHAGVNVLTQHNDNARTGANTAETILTPENVNFTQFGKLFDLPVDGEVHAQPLYMSGLVLTVNGKKTAHNVLFVATEHDSVYAFDADSNTGANTLPLWKVSFIDYVQAVTTVPTAEAPGITYGPELGISSTPVIDVATGTLYVVARTKTFNAAAPGYEPGWGYQVKLHALDVRTGKEKFGGPVAIQPSAFGKGVNSVDGVVKLHPLYDHCSTGLLLHQNSVCIAFGGADPAQRYHGWVVAYNKSTLKQTGVYCTSPETKGAGIITSGNGLAADAQGNLYFATGRSSGGDDIGQRQEGNFGASFLKLALSPTGALRLTDFFAPYDQPLTNAFEGSRMGLNGVLLLPPVAGLKLNLLMGLDDGSLFIINRSSMGGYNPYFNPVHQENNSALPNGNGHSAAYFNNRIYLHNILEGISAYDVLPTSVVAPAEISQAANFNGTSSTPSISANGTRNGVVWDVYEGFKANLYAYRADNLTRSIYDISEAAGGRDFDESGRSMANSMPTIANGKVYVPNAESVSVFGLLHTTTNLDMRVLDGGHVTQGFAGSTPRVTNQTYTVTAVPDPGMIFVGWFGYDWPDENAGQRPTSRNPTFTFAMKENLTLEAVFIENPFPPLKGNYSGQVITASADSQSFAPAAIVVSGNGSFTGSITVDGEKLPLNGTFLSFFDSGLPEEGASGEYVTTIPRRGKPTLTVRLQIGFSLDGDVTDGTTIRRIEVQREHETMPGRLTLGFQHPGDPTQPQGNGYGTAVVNNKARLTFAGVLGDGTAVTQSTLIANGEQGTPGAVWNFYAAPYGTHGSILGKLVFNFENTAELIGKDPQPLRWIKDATATPGIHTFTNVILSSWDKAAFPVIELRDVTTFEITGGNLYPAPAPKQFSIEPFGNLVLEGGSTGLTLKLDTATGLIAGTFTDANNKVYACKGAALQRHFTFRFTEDTPEIYGQFKNGTATGAIHAARKQAN